MFKQTKKFWETFFLFYLMMIAWKMMRIILFGTDQDVNSWEYRSWVLISSILGALLITGLVHYLLKKDILKYRKHLCFSFIVAISFLLWRDEIPFKEDFINNRIVVGIGGMFFTVIFLTLFLYTFIYMYERIFKKKFIVFKEKTKNRNVHQQKI